MNKKMKRIKNIIFFLILFCSLNLFLSSCDTPPKKQKVQNIVTKKIISLNQDQVKTTSDQVKTTSDQVKTTSDKVKTTSDKVETTSDKIKHGTNNKQLKEKTKKKSNNIQRKISAYISIGKTDPFKPLIQNEPKEAKQNVKKQGRHKLTPLEKIDISQLKLVAVIKTKKKKKDFAMVQEANRKGYIVRVGTYIGINEGRITEIHNNEIIIKEWVKNFKGVYQDQFIKMQLQKENK